MALEMGATGLILCHNHPSGLVPSDADKQITKKLRTAGAA
jgi:DNA repair protein RadC